MNRNTTARGDGIDHRPPSKLTQEPIPVAATSGIPIASEIDRLRAENAALRASLTEDTRLMSVSSSVLRLMMVRVETLEAEVVTLRRPAIQTERNRRA